MSLLFAATTDGPLITVRLYPWPAMPISWISIRTLARPFATSQVEPAPQIYIRRFCPAQKGSRSLRLNILPVSSRGRLSMNSTLLETV